MVLNIAKNTWVLYNDASVRLWNDIFCLVVIRHLLEADDFDGVDQLDINSLLWCTIVECLCCDSQGWRAEHLRNEARFRDLISICRRCVVFELKVVDLVITTGGILDIEDGLKAEALCCRGQEVDLLGEV